MSENASKKQKTNPERVDSPVVREIKRLVEGVKKDVQSNLKSCRKSIPNIHVASYRNLAESVLMRLVTFNMSRLGDMSRMTIQDWEKYREGQKCSKDAEILDSLSDLEKKIAKDFTFIRIENKSACLVPPDAQEGIEFLLYYRKMVGVFSSNPMVFGIPERMQHIQANDVLRTYTKKHCVHPQQIQSPKQRPYLAIASQILDLGEKGKEYLVNDLGDYVKAQTDFYQKYSDVGEVAKVSQILLVAESDKNPGRVEESQSDFNGNEVSKNDVGEKRFESTEEAQNDCSDSEIVQSSKQEDCSGDVKDYKKKSFKSNGKMAKKQTEEESPSKKEKKGTGYNRPMKLSSELAAVVGQAVASRGECIKQLWAYLKNHNLQDPANKQYFTPDKQMAKIFGTEKIRGFGMAKFLNSHFSEV